MFRALVEHNETRDADGRPSGWQGYNAANADLRRVFELEFDFPALEDESEKELRLRACEWLFGLFNTPDDMLTSAERGWTARYRALRLRSLSVGDVILLSSAGGPWQAYAVEAEGFRPVSMPSL